MDAFAQSYRNQLENTYDCPDRIVINAYFSMGMSAGGFRTWWRDLNGSDEKLDKEHLMRMAGRFSRRLHAYANANDIPVIDCAKGERKHLIAAGLMPTDPNFQGLFAVLTSRESAMVWDVEQTKDGRIKNLSSHYRYVKYYYFHILDPDWGHLTIGMSGHPPFGARIILNGHEYLARQASKNGIEFEKEGNCFSNISDIDQFQQIADTLTSAEAAGLLQEMCDRWLYSSCLYFGLKPEEQKQSRFRYAYSIFQVEYSRNYIFNRGVEMEQIFQSLIDWGRTELDINRIKTIFGVKRRPFRHRGKQQPREENLIEKPTYDLTVFKIHFGKTTIKLYTKGERVLRCEVIIHNTKALRGFKRSLPHFAPLVNHLKEILERFTGQMHALSSCFVTDDELDTISQPGRLGDKRTAGIDLNQPRLRTVLEAVRTLSIRPGGFKSSDLAHKVRQILRLNESQYTSRHAAYDLRKLRGKELAHRLGKSRFYAAAADGLRIISALINLRERVIKPILSSVGKPAVMTSPNDTPLDKQYQILQKEMQILLQQLGFAV